jgi:signal transduction histidine kinase
MVFGTVFILSLLLNTVIRYRFNDYMEKVEKERSDFIAQQLSSYYNSFSGTWDEGAIHGIGMFALYDGYFVRVTNANGKIVWDAWNHDMTLCAEIMDEITERMNERHIGAEVELVSVEYPIYSGRSTDDKSTILAGTITIQYYGPFFLSEEAAWFLDTLNAVLLIVGGISLVVSIIIGLLLARRIASPVTKSAEIARSIASGDYKIRFEEKTKMRELDDLTESINHLADGLLEQEALRKRLTADVAHELRTPLSAISAHLEAMSDGVWEPTKERLLSCYEESVRLSKLVSDLEKLAVADNENFNLNLAPVNLKKLSENTVATFEREIKEKELKVSVLGSETEVMLDAGRFTQVIANLLHNAIKHTPKGGEIKITVTSGAFTIEDTGEGIPEKDLPYIFERFYRVDPSRSRESGGTGIGLAIAKAIVKAHGGDIIATSQEGKGSRFEVRNI